MPGECMGVGAKCQGNAGECMGMPGEHMEVGAKCQGNARECKRMPGEHMGVGAVPWECREIQGNARGTYGRGVQSARRM